ncbi:hypothetical protein ABZX85_11400 [Streptomyces sp. NPDC004539]|uniref:hypothetical protein n=1 Tax=Streptomyces sp. NPDC004539 TaxID=3154280 RepID=UPI0033A66155
MSAGKALDRQDGRRTADSLADTLELALGDVDGPALALGSQLGADGVSRPVDEVLSSPRGREITKNPSVQEAIKTTEGMKGLQSGRLVAHFALKRVYVIYPTKRVQIIELCPIMSKVCLE